MRDVYREKLPYRSDEFISVAENYGTLHSSGDWKLLGGKGINARLDEIPKENQR